MRVSPNAARWGPLALPSAVQSGRRRYASTIDNHTSIIDSLQPTLRVQRSLEGRLGQSGGCNDNSCGAFSLAGVSYSLYPSSDHVVVAFRDELAPYEIGKGTIRFPLSEPVPVRLIEGIAKLRAKEVVEREKGKAAAPKKR